MAEIDYLNDALLEYPEDAPKAAKTPLVERAAEVLNSINIFMAETGAKPVSAPGRSVRERMLANALAGLRAARDELRELEHADRFGLVFARVPQSDESMADPLLADPSDIFAVRDALRPKEQPDYVADRTPCADFERFAPLFDAVRKDLEAGHRHAKEFRGERVELGGFYVLKGQLVYVADLRDEAQRKGRPDARLRVIFDNETESDHLMSSLVRRLHKDKGRRITGMETGPLFEGARTGFVYVLRSRSDRPEVQGLLKVGTTAGAVEDRIARAETQGAFLFAPVEILETYELRGHSAKEAERYLHQALRPYQILLKVTGPDGRVYRANEWFRVTSSTVTAAITKLLN